jgi:trypsin
VADFLQKAMITTVNQEECAKAYDDVWITDRMICLGNMEEGGLDGCTGDSGGPFAVDGVLIGITCWGVGCARPLYPGVWTRVTSFRDWIDSNIAD